MNYGNHVQVPLQVHWNAEVRTTKICMLTQSPYIVVPSTLHISLTKAATSLGLGRESLVSVAVNENPGKDPTGNVLLCYLRVATNNSHFIHTVFSIYIVLLYTSTLQPSRIKRWRSFPLNSGREKR